jgi:hypothetical protein
MKWIWIALACLASCRSPNASEAALEARVAALEASHVELLETVNEAQAHVERMYEIVASQLVCVSPPQIDGSVLSIEQVRSLDLVRIDRGSQDGVTRGLVFEVYRDAQYKGRVRVETVQANECTAVILKIYEGRTIDPGDSASTMI